MKLLTKILQLIVVCSLPGIGTIVAQTSPSLTYQLRSKDFDVSNSAQLLVTADIPPAFGKVEVQFVTPPEFAIEPDTLKFDPQPGKRIVAAVVRRADEAVSGEYSIIAHSNAQPSSAGSSFAVDQVINFTYTKRLKVKFYLILGLLGFTAGYFLRLASGVLKKVPAPAAAPPAGQEGATGNSQDGPITKYAKAHYYRVDFGVSLVLAFAVLLYLIRDGHPPDSAAAWYGALLTGIGLGFLTNNDLMARIKG